MVEIKILINGVAQANDRIKLESGFTHKETITDELENKTAIFLVAENDKNIIKENDIVEIQRLVNNEFIDREPFLVSYLEKELFTKTPPFYWKITAILVEPTKLLERITLPPCSFTNANDNLFDIFKKALDKAFIKRGSTQSSRFVLESSIYSIKDLLNGVKGEDFIYNKPTLLREVLDDILLIKNARVEVWKRQGTQIYLRYKPLTYETREIKEIDLLSYQGIKHLKEIVGINGKANDYETYVKGVYSLEQPKQPYLLTWENWQTLKPVEIDLQTTKNLKLTTSFPIEKVNSIVSLRYHKIEVFTDLSTSSIIEVPIYTYLNDNIVVPEEIYSALSLQDQKKYIPYQRGSKEIGILQRAEGFIFDYEILYQYERLNFEEYIANKGYYEWNTSSPQYPQWKPISTSERLFRVNYNAYLDQHYSFTKEYTTKDCGTILASPSESLIDSKRYADKVYNIAKSQGNMRLELDYFIDNIKQGEMFLLGDRIKYQGKIFTITEREKAFEKEYVKDHIVLEENYIPELPEKLSRERQIFINPTDNVVERNVLLKDIITFNLNSNYQERSFVGYNKINELLIKSFVDNEMVLPIETALIRLEEEKPIISSTYYALQTAAQRVGKSIIYNFGFLDNYSAGYSVGDTVVGGKKVNLNSYVDSNGELKEVYLELLTNKMSMALGSALEVDPTPALIDTIEKLPKINYSKINDLYNRPNMANGNKICLEKDRLEHITFTYQLEFLSTPEIVIGNAFLDCLRLIGGFIDGNLKIYGDTENLYTDNDKQAKGELVSGASIIKLTEEIALHNIDTTQYKSVGIADKNGNLILGINNHYLDKKTIYTRIKQAR